MAHGRFGQIFLFLRIKSFESEKGHVRFAHERLLSPKANQFRRAFPENVRDHHAVNASGGRRSGSVQVGIAVDPQKIQVVVVAASGGQQADGLRAIAAEDQHQGAAFHRQFRAQLQVVEAGDDLGEIAGPAMLFVVGKKARRTIAVIDDLVTRGLEPINNPGGTQSRGGFLAAERKGCGARRRADQGNLLRLTDDLNRQVRLPVLSYPAAAPVLPRPERKHAVLPVLRGVSPGNGRQPNSQRRGAGAMVANSGGKMNRTSSRMRSKSR